MIMLRHRDLLWRDVLKIASTMAFAAALFAFQLAASSANATGAKPSPCKGLDEATCGATAECSWVKGSTKVKPYCRAKPAPKPKAKAAPKAPAASGQ